MKLNAMKYLMKYFEWIKWIIILWIKLILGVAVNIAIILKLYK